MTRPARPHPAVPRLKALLLALALLLAPAVLAPAAQAATGKPIDIVKIHFDPLGRDAATNSGWNQEYILVKNVSTATVTLTGYRLKDSGPQSFTFPTGTKLGPGKTLTIRSGTGRNTSSTLYWGKRSYIWNNDRDSARLLSRSGALLETCSYTWKPSTRTTGSKTC